MQLLQSSGDAQIDHILCGLMEQFEQALPGRVAAAYLVGSRADGSAVAASDIDLRLVVGGDFQPGEQERFLQARQIARAGCPLPLDCPPLSQARLQTEEWLHEALSLKAASLHLWGTDLGPDLPMPTLDAFARNVTTAPLRFFRQVHHIPIPHNLPYPLDYPDPQAEFFGYSQPDSPNDPPEGRLKMLVHIAGFAATCRLALEAGTMVIRKPDWLPAYRQHIHDDWLPYLEELVARCKIDWQYRLPADTTGRRQLQGLCRQTLTFENDYLGRYFAWLKAGEASGDPARAEFARRRLAELEIQTK